MQGRAVFPHEFTLKNPWGKRGANIKRKIAKCVIFHDLAIFGGDSYRTQTCNLLIRSQMLYSIELRSQVAGDLPGLFFGGRLDAHLLLADAGLLAGELTKVEDAGATDVADFVQFDILDER